MISRNRLNNPSTLIRIGSAGLLIFNFSHWFLHPSAAFLADCVDFVGGAALGVAIGTMLLAARIHGRRGASSCA